MNDFVYLSYRRSTPGTRVDEVAAVSSSFEAAAAALDESIIATEAVTEWEAVTTDGTWYQRDVFTNVVLDAPIFAMFYDAGETVETHTIKRIAVRHTAPAPITEAESAIVRVRALTGWTSVGGRDTNGVDRLVPASEILEALGDLA